MKTSLLELRRSKRSVLLFGNRPTPPVRQMVGPRSRFAALDWRRLDDPEVCRPRAEAVLRGLKGRTPLVLLGSRIPPWAAEVLANYTRTQVAFALSFTDHPPPELSDCFSVRLGFELIGATS